MLKLDERQERWELSANIISFTDLLLRWPYKGIINIAYELEPDIYGQIDKDNDSLPLMIYLCDDSIIGQDGQKMLRIRPVHINSIFHDILSNISNVVVLRTIVERLEINNINYLWERPLNQGENSLLLTTLDNIREVVVYTLWAWKRAMKQKGKIKDAAYDLKSDFWTEIFTAPAKDWLSLIPESLDFSFSATKNSAAAVTTEPTEKNAEAARQFASQFPLRTTADRLIALEALFDAGFPRFENNFIGEIFWPDRTHVAPETLKSYGNRLYRQLRDKTGKEW